MKVDSFLDTNIFVYAAAARSSDVQKCNLAMDMISNQDFGISSQVLQEFYVTVTRKLVVPLSPLEALEWIEALEVFPCAVVDSTLVKIAVELSVRFQISYWDGAILAAAEALGAQTLCTEDLNHGQWYGSVQVQNPFRAPA